MSASRACGSRELTTVSWWLPENVMDAGSVTKWQPASLTRAPLGEVTLSTGPIPRAPVTFFIIILYFESPATTSPAAQQTSVSVKHIRLGVPLRYDGKPRVLLHNIVKWSVSD